MNYQPIQMPQPQGLGGLAEFMAQMRQQRELENTRRAELLLRQQSEADQSRHRQVLEQHAGQQLAIQQGQAKANQDRMAEEIAQKRLTAKKDIYAALDAQRPDLARAIGKSIGLEVGDIPGQDPRNALMRPSNEVPNEPPKPPPDLDIDMADDKGAVQANEAAIADYKTKLAQRESGSELYAEPTRFEFGGMQPVRHASYQVAGESYDPEEVQRSQQAKIERNSQRFAGAMQGVKGLGDYIPIYQAAVNAGNTPQEAFKFMNDRMKSDDEAAARAENARLQREQSDVNNRRIAGAMGNRVTHDDPFKGAAAARGEEAAIDQMTKTVFGGLGFKEARSVGGKYTRMAQMLANPNAASDAVVAGSFVKEAQGGSGVISDADMEHFWGKIGGAETRTKQWVEGVLSGKIHPEKRAIVKETINALAQFEVEKQQRVKEGLRHRFENSSFAHRTNDVIGTYFPDERPAIEDAKAIDRAKNRTRAGRVKGAGRDKLDEELDGL